MTLAEMLAQADAVTQGVELHDGKFDPITPGDYTVQITNAEGPLASKRSNPTNPSEFGQYIKIECTITGPSFIGRKVWFNNNIIVFPKSLSQDDTAKAQVAMKMGSVERQVMLDSLGKVQLQTAVELVGASFGATIATEKGTNGYPDKSVIKSIKPIGAKAKAAPAAPRSNASPFPAINPSPAPQPEAPTVGNYPWMRK